MKKLSTEKITDAALYLSEKNGLEALSLRSLAKNLNCEAMSLYHHFKNKGELLDSMADRLVSYIEINSEPKGDWQEFMRDVAGQIRALAFNYPATFSLLIQRRANHHAYMNFVNIFLGRLQNFGFTAKQSVEIFRAAGFYIFGAMQAELTIKKKSKNLTKSNVDAGSIPSQFSFLTDSKTYLGEQYAEKIFWKGYEALLAGLAAKKKK